MAAKSQGFACGPNETPGWLYTCGSNADCNVLADSLDAVLTGNHDIWCEPGRTISSIRRNDCHTLKVRDASCDTTAARLTGAVSALLGGENVRFFCPNPWGFLHLGDGSRESCEQQVVLLNSYLFTIGPTTSNPTPPPTRSPSDIPTSSSPTLFPSRLPTTGSPTAWPTTAPTQHACDDGSHACDTTEFGTCTPLISDPDRHRCGCADGHQCSDGDCGTVGHTCVPITEAPTQSPTTNFPTSAPTAEPTTPEPMTADPTTRPTTFPTILPTMFPTDAPTDAPSTATPPQSSSSNGGGGGGGNSLAIIIGAILGAVVLVVLLILVACQRVQNETRRLPAVPPAIDNPNFAAPAEYATVDYAEVENAVPARARTPQYDEVGFVRDQYAELNSNHSIYNSDA